MVVMLSSMLHSIGVGNMLPSWVKVVCVDINPAVVTKLSDRGSTQTIGIVTDVGLFLHQLARALQEAGAEAKKQKHGTTVRNAATSTKPRDKSNTFVPSCLRDAVVGSVPVTRTYVQNSDRSCHPGQHLAEPTG